MTSDQIASFALIVSISSSWIAYRSWYQSRKLITAEKRTQVWSALVEIRLALQDLHFTILEISRAWEERGLNTGPSSSPATEEILAKHKRLQSVTQSYGDEISKVANLVQTGLERFKASSRDDPVALEESRAMAIEMEARVNNLATNTSNLKAEIEKYSQRYGYN